MDFQQARDRMWENVSRVTAVSLNGTSKNFTVVTISSGQGGLEEVESVVDENKLPGDYVDANLIEFPLDSEKYWKVVETFPISKKPLR